MPPIALELLDLPLALRRVREDALKGRTFIQHPFELALVELDVPSWLELLAAELRAESYTPGGMQVAPIPKGRGFVRPGGVLPLWDQVVYTAAVGAALPHIRAAITREGPPIDFSYHLDPSNTAVEWLSNPYRGWKAFREQNLARLAEPTRWVVKGDVVGCYENIALRTLFSDLRGAGVPEEIVVLISKCLNRWSQIPGRGIPQGMAASHLLAKLYLTRVDQALAELGFAHHRYVDDFVVFTETRARGKEALIALTGLLRKRGMNLQAGKTALLSATEAPTEIDQVTSALQHLASRFINEIADAVGIDPGYLSLHDAEQLLAQRADHAPIELLRSAYQTHCVNCSSRINRSLFHYLLNRLGNANDRSALNHSIGLLEEYPEETEAILRYAGRVSNILELESTIVSYLSSAENVYAFQQHQIIAWRSLFEIQPSNELLAYVRRLMHRTSVSWLRSTCRAFVGQFGTAADLDYLEEQYDQAAGPLERAELVVCLQRLELSRRNSLYSLARAEGEYPRRAVRLAIEARREAVA